MNSHTDLAGVYRVDMSLQEMNTLLYHGAVDKRVRTLAGQAVKAWRGHDCKGLAIALSLLEMVGQEEGWV